MYTFKFMTEKLTFIVIANTFEQAIKNVENLGYKLPFSNLDTVRSAVNPEWFIEIEERIVNIDWNPNK